MISFLNIQTSQTKRTLPVEIQNKNHQKQLQGKKSVPTQLTFGLKASVATCSL